ncbi:uncharacterized protein LOC132641309 [Lycium barbarum]|uniref:uncharacterized protein LOC132641309 n=1 Tax=Lycium barbarum TaxID=112863 RepID=UPI00293E78FB|nr:uncharacterized protein LOC132641309 [Lycium barbarum]
MKMRNKGKVHPSPSSSCTSSNKDNNNNNTLSILNLLPATILAIASVLSLQDREVLAYMVTRSMKQPITTTFSKKKIISHKTPLFDCECFDCYTTYWLKWDSSPNRELIHQVIEAFEEHLNTNEHNKNHRNNNKKKDKKGHSFVIIQEEKQKFILPENIQEDDEFVHVSPENDVAVDVSPENDVLRRSTAASGGHKGLARKVLPDVLGLFNSRLWNLWNPNV